MALGPVGRQLATVQETSLGHQEGHQEYYGWYTCLQGDSPCIQPIMDVLIAFSLEKSLCPFLVMLEYRVRCKSHLLTKAIMPLALTRTKPLSHQLLSLISQLLHMQSLDSTTYAFSHSLMVLCTNTQCYMIKVCFSTNIYIYIYIN